MWFGDNQRFKVFGFQFWFSGFHLVRVASGAGFWGFGSLELERLLGARVPGFKGKKLVCVGSAKGAGF